MQTIAEVEAHMKIWDNRFLGFILGALFMLFLLH